MFVDVDMRFKISSNLLHFARNLIYMIFVFMEKRYGNRLEQKVEISSKTYLCI